jgi:protein TonB
MLFVLLGLVVAAPPGTVEPSGPAGGGAAIVFTTTGTPPRRLKGSISDRDVPAFAGAHFNARVEVRYTVGLDGRASHCRVLNRTGVPQLEELTCSLIVRRFRFEPSRDASGRPQVADIVEVHAWVAGERRPRPKSRRAG